jgi:uncharacterized protein YcfL
MDKFISLLFVGVFFLSGCSSLPAQKNVSANPELWNTKQKIGLYVSSIPKITTGFPGASCLLCYGVASLAHTSLSKQVETYQAKQLMDAKNSLVSLLKAKGVEVVIIDALIKDAKMSKLKAGSNPHIKHDYSIYKKQYDIDQLLVVNFLTVGVLRNYSSYVPVDVPRVVISAQFYMIDTKANDYSLFNPLNITKGSDGEWDKPPVFPGITNAFYQAEEVAYDQLIASFK